MTEHAPLPARTPSPNPIPLQMQRYLDLGLPALAGMTETDFRGLAADLPADAKSALVVVHPHLIPASILAMSLRHNDKPGFVVVDMTDLDDFARIEQVQVPDEPLYLVTGIERGDDFRDETPNDSLPRILAAGRTPLTVSEGISWLLQRPDVLEANACFMTIGSRIRNARGGLDARTPAIWISGGTGRDGRERKGAPKVGWCWAGNRHTWLGMASAASRIPAP